jgi:Transposase DDE domain group 1
MTPSACVMIRRCAGLLAARRLRAVRLHRARWAASRRNGSRYENLSAIADLSGQWIDLVHGRRPPRSIVLDMDSSVSPTHGEQEMSVWNGHYACTCYHPLFVFNQFGLRPASRQRAQRRRLGRLLKPMLDQFQWNFGAAAPGDLVTLRKFPVPPGQGAELLETRGRDGLSDRMIEASYSASRSFLTTSS